MTIVRKCLKIPERKRVILNLVLLVLLGCTVRADEGVVGLWHFDGDSQDATKSWSGFGRSSHGKIEYENPRVGVGAYSAVHGEDTRSDWRHHAVGRILLHNHAMIDGLEEVGIALWVRPVKIWARNGRVISFGQGAFGVANDPVREGVFRIVNAGLAKDDALPSFELPMDVWSHLAVTADGDTVRVLVDGVLVGEAPQTGPLQGSETLYLGALAGGGMGLLGTYIDELIFYRGPVGVEWAEEVYFLTKDGEPYPYEAPELEPFQAVERDMSAFLQITPSQVDLAAGGETRVTVTATETPLFGPYISPRRLRGEEEVLAVIEDLKAHNCNTIVVPVNWCLTRAPLMELFHQHNFYVFAIVPPPYGRDLVREIPDVAQRDEEGNTLATASFYDPRFIQYLIDEFLAEDLEGRGIDGLILDEPSHRDYRAALRTGTLYHAHPAEREAYKRMFNEDYPDIDLTANPDPEDYAKVMQFRQQMIHDWLDLVDDLVHARAQGVNYHIVFTPDNVSNHRYQGYLTGVEATGINIDRVLESDTLRGIQMTAYLNAWGDRSPEWARQFLPQFKDRAHEEGKASVFWAQAYMESPTHVERGMHPGHISELIHLTVGEGVDGMLLWHYRGFSQDDYGWNEFFEEFGEAAGDYHDRPAEGLTFRVAAEDADLSVEVVDLGGGEYALTLRGAGPGKHTLVARNRLGVERTLNIHIK